MAEKKLKITVEAFTGQAAAQLKGLTGGLRGVQTGVRGLSGAGGMLKNAISFGAGILSAQLMVAAISAVKNAVVDFAKTGVAKVESFKLSVLGTTAFLTSMAKSPSPAVFAQNLEYARAAMQRLTAESAKAIGTASDLQSLFKQAVVRGVAPVTAEDFANLRRFSDMVTITMPEGMDSQRRIMTEIKAITTGTVPGFAILGKMIQGQTADFKEQVLAHKKAGDLWEWIGTKLIGMKFAQAEVLGLTTTWKNTLTSIWGTLTRRAFVDVHADIVGYLKQVKLLLMDQHDQFTPLAHLITSTIKAAWEDVRGSVQSILKLLIENAPLLVQTLGEALRSVGEWANWTLRTVLALIQAVNKAEFARKEGTLRARAGLWKDRLEEAGAKEIRREPIGGLEQAEAEKAGGVDKWIDAQAKARLRGIKQAKIEIREVKKEWHSLLEEQKKLNLPIMPAGKVKETVIPPFAPLGGAGGGGKGGEGGAASKEAQKITEQAYKFLQSLEVDWTRITKGEAAARLLTLKNEYREKMAEAVKFKASEADMAKLTAVYEAERTKIKREEAEKQKKIGADYRASVLSNEESLRRSLAALTTSGYDLEILQANQALQDRVANNRKIYDDAVAAGIKSESQLKMLQENEQRANSLAIAIFLEEEKKANKDRTTNAASAAHAIISENQNILEEVMKKTMTAKDYEIWAEGERYRLAVDAVNQRITLITGEGEAEVQQKTLLHQQIEYLGQDHAARMKAIAEAQGGEWAKMWQDTAKQAAASLASIIAYAGNFKDWFSNLWRGLVYKVLFKIFDDMVDKWLESMAKMAAAQVGGGFLSGLLGGILGAIFPPAKILTAPLGGGAVMAQHGGLVPGMGSGDTVPAMLEPQELIVPKTITTTVSQIMGVSPPLYPSTGLSFWKDFIKTMALGKVKGGVMKAQAGGLVPGYQGEKQTSPSWLSSLLETGRQAMPRISSSEFGKIPRYSSGANFFQGFMDLVRGGASPPMLQLAGAGGGHTINVQVNTYGNNYSQADAESIADTVQERIAQKLWGNR